jgi:UPF0716 family protein affecting phage T7 exclusion
MNGNAIVDGIVVVQVGSSIEAVIVVSIVVVFAAVGLYIWRVLRRASLLLQSISIRVRNVPKNFLTVCISCDSPHFSTFFIPFRVAGQG